MTTIQILVSGVLIGGVYALLAVGITLVLGVMKIVNFAQGELLMVGMYLTLLLHTVLGLHPYVAFPIVVVALFGLGAGIHFGLLRWVVDRGHTQQIVLTLGIGIVLQSAALMIFGGSFQSLQIEPFRGGSIVIGSISIGTTRLAAFVVAGIATIALLFLLDRTLTGKAMRATAMDRDAATLMGIPVQRVYLITMGIGSALAGAAGVMLMPIYPVYPTVGVNILLIGFVVVVLGGLGSVAGAFLGGIIIGVVEALAGFWLGAAMSQIVVFALFIVILLVRPQGILKGDTV
ncbi:branched-chain amino acid ABC transporter permease [Cryobacterium glaciale]|uniref:Branched-chain amino acid ABC transporter permease n=1 Tax=Cryobacterium glaciale TaxID=1259145 RepID=A0A4V3I905_9MICO|nr:branched-chain amino acid ABC transporter permease [Cryobacterium glaciale]TFB77297.1 branched-chain amino acid ABC transporter permease [Cryobacterium glaciale]